MGDRRILFILLVISVFGVWVYGRICESPPILSPAEIPFDYDVNVPNVIGYLQINRGETKCWDVNICDDTNELGALVAGGLPPFIAVDPPDFYLSDKYLNQAEQQEYRITAEPNESTQPGVYYLTLAVKGQYHQDVNAIEWFTIPIKVDPNAGEPPIVEPPIWKPCAVNP